MCLCCCLTEQSKDDQANDDGSFNGVAFANDFSIEKAPMKLGVHEAIHLELKVGRVIFKVTSPMIYLLQIKWLFGGKVVDHVNQHMKICVEVCLPFKIWNMSQELERVKLFPFLLTGCVVIPLGGWVEMLT